MMSTAPLSYESSDNSKKPRRWWLVPCIIFAVFIFIPTPFGFTLKQVESRMDPVTGSMTWKTVWIFGINFGTRVDVSPLETRLKNSSITWTQTWQFLHNTHRNIFGNAASYQCGSAPAIYQLRPVLKEFATVSTDEELREFVRIMQSGTDEEQRISVKAAGDKALQAITATR